MPKLKNLKKLPQLDMNPMVDMAFLLVTFFMMTTTFKSDSPTEVTLPTSHAELKIPEKNICTISIEKTGQFYFGLDNKYDRRKMLEFVSKQTNLAFDENQLERFSIQSSFGVSLDELGTYLNLEGDDRKAYQQNGILVDSTQNELKQWVMAARVANPRLRFAINADEDVAYPHIHRCIETLRDLNINRFNLITEAPIDDSNS